VHMLVYACFAKKLIFLYLEDLCMSSCCTHMAFVCKQLCIYVQSCSKHAQKKVKLFHTRALSRFHSLARSLARCLSFSLARCLSLSLFLSLSLSLPPSLSLSLALSLTIHTHTLTHTHTHTGLMVWLSWVHTKPTEVETRRVCFNQIIPIDAPSYELPTHAHRPHTQVLCA